MAGRKRPRRPKQSPNHKTPHDQELTQHRLRALPDRELVRLARQERQLDEVFAILYHRIRNKVFSTVNRMCIHPNPDVVEEVVERAFVTAYLRLGRFDPDGTAEFSSWVCRIARNHMLKAFRENRRRDACLKAMDSLCALSVPGPEAAYRHRREELELRKRVCRLPKARKQAVVLHIMHGWKYKDIAAKLGGTPRQWRHRVCRALEGMKDEEGTGRKGQREGKERGKGAGGKGYRDKVLGTSQATMTKLQ